MSRQTLVRWTVPTVVLLGLAWLYSAFGHTFALIVMLMLLVAVAVLTKPARDDGPDDAADGDAT